MHAPQLEVPPTTDAKPKELIEPRADKINAWIDELPLANPFESVRELLKLIGQYNRVEIPAEKRFLVMKSIITVIDQLGPTLRKDYADAQLPLADRKRQRAVAMQDLWMEVGYAYKHVIMDIILTKKRVVNPGEVLAPAIRQASHALAQRLLEAFIVFAPTPPLIWRELNQLFLYASTHSIDETPLALDKTKNIPEVNIGQSYRQALLLSLADPYHMMPGEAIKLLNDVKLWAKFCELKRLANKAPPDRKYYIDLTDDSGPRFNAKDQHVGAIESGAVIDTTKLYTVVNNRLAEVTTAKFRHGHSAHSTLSQRLQREMYQRLARAWSPRNERASQRESTTDRRVILASGLNACHFYAGAGKPFNPEQDEALIQQQSHPRDIEADIELVSDAHMPWIDEIDLQHAAAGTNSPHTTEFPVGIGTTTDHGIWRPELFSSVQQERQRNQETQSAEQARAEAQVQDASHHGLALSFPPSNSAIQTRVGDLVAIHTGGKNESNDEKSSWRIGGTRWLRTCSDKGLELGIEIFADDGLAVATKAVEGIGRGTDYFRGLLIPKRNPRTHPTTLITLPAVYDAGTVLQLNTGSALLRVRLINLLEGTNSYARFEFRILNSQ